MAELLPAPTPRVTARRVPPGTLALAEIVVLRRLRAGQSKATIARDTRIARRSVDHKIAAACKRFSVDTQDELLALPEVLALLDETAATTPATHDQHPTAARSGRTAAHDQRAP